MIILGIDPALNNCGWAIIEYEQKNNSMTYIDSGVIKNITKIDYIEKINIIIIFINNLTKQYKLDILSIEDTFVNINPSSSLKLGIVRGAIIAIGLINNLKIYEFKPNQIKSTLTGNGKADKQQINYMIKTILPKAKPESFDESDAIAIAITCAFRMNIKYIV